jgi:NosR/NirI family nitrous oxide reductase transcriptional regulator
MIMAGMRPDLCGMARRIVLIAVALVPAVASAQDRMIDRLLTRVTPEAIAEGADAFGPVRSDVPVAPVLRGGQMIGWAFVTSDFVGTTGYSGKPIHVIAAVGPDAKLLGAQLIEHHEPIVLVGIPEAKVKALIAGYAGLDLAAEAAEGGSAHDLDIISGATVTVMVIDDSIVRSGLRVARALGLGGLAPPTELNGPRFELDPDVEAPSDWESLVGDGSVRRLSLDVGQVNRAFEETGDARARERPEQGDDSESFIDLYTALVSVPGIGRSLLGSEEFAALQEWLAPGEHAILVAGRGRYSFKGSGYVRGGLFDRIQLIQGDASVRFRDRDHRRVGSIAAAGAPSFTESDLFRIPADSGFDPAAPWRLQLLVQRAVGPIEKLFTTFDLGYQPPERFLRPVPVAAVPATPAPAPEAEASEAEAKAALWQRIWREKRLEIAGLLAMLGTLTGAFFFQGYLTRSERYAFWFRIVFLTVTLVFLGWYANAQLSVVNLMALASSLATGFTWDAFLLEPLTFILWFSVAAALIFWGRGAYCGWLCPFGALQELLNRLAKTLRIPQWTVPWWLHERLWAVKYILFLGLFGVSLASVGHAERLAEVEPFKTAIVLKFNRAWPFVLYAGVLLFCGLFVERFYCRYFCPLGAALAIPGRVRMFDWLKRYHECGNPCQVCANECMVQAIHPTGEINPNECHYCLHCQVLYRSENRCPVVIRQVKRRQVHAESTRRSAAALERAIGSKSRPEEDSHV